RYESESCPLWKMVVDSCNDMEITNRLNLIDEDISAIKGIGIWSNILKDGLKNKELLQILKL
ncbi:hypothetical protein PIB30_102248, partial [Stylosanthes scabra]|nr:hypothetical protein [Stylosanthes scabra]